jgi:hypothetical protein
MHFLNSTIRSEHFLTEGARNGVAHGEQRGNNSQGETGAAAGDAAQGEKTSLQSVRRQTSDLLTQSSWYVQPEAINDSNACGAAQADDTARQSTVPESENAYATCPSSIKPPPRLSATQSAPAVEMEAMISQSPSQRSLGGLTRAATFHGYPDGDTQPLGSQVYKHFTESMARSANTTPKKPTLISKISPDRKAAYVTETMDQTPHTCVEGESGHINLLSDWQSQAQDQDPPSESSHVDELLRSERTQQPTAYSQRAMPETPSLAGRKHGRDGEVLEAVETTVEKTPGYSKMFGNLQTMPLMSNTQLFEFTQNPSSPLPEGPRSDPIVTRPSPNLQSMSSPTSPALLISSPAATRPHGTTTAFGEPRTKYTSMKESQELKAKAAALRQEFGISQRFGEFDSDDDDSDDDDDDLVREQFARKRRDRLETAKAMLDLENVSATSRPGSRQNSSPKRHGTINLVTPGTEKRVDIADYEVSEDGHVTDDEVISPVAQDEEDAHSNDEYDELGQSVMRSQGPEPDSEDEDEHPDGEAVVDASNARNVFIDDTPVASNAAQDPNNKLQGTLRNTGQPAPTQPSAIADSQPMRQAAARPLVREQTDERVSLSSFVPGSRYAGKTSMDRFATASQQNQASQQVQPTEDDRVPSSPPLSPIDEAMVDDDEEKQRQNQQSYIPPTLQQPRSGEMSGLEVPEGDLAGIDGSDEQSHRRSTVHESNSNQLFSTARSQISASATATGHTGGLMSPIRVYASQQSKSTSMTPRAAAGVRHFADITDATATPNPSGDSQVDFDGLLNGIFTAEDEQVFELLSSPTSERAQKRRKIVHTTEASSSPVKGPGRRTTRNTRARLPAPTDEDDEDTQQGAATAAEETHQDVLRDVPNRANELLSSKRVAEDTVQSTPASVKEREKAGASAASQLLARRSSRAPKASTLRSVRSLKARGKKQEVVNTSLSREESEISIATDGNAADSHAKVDEPATPEEARADDEVAPNEAQAQAPVDSNSGVLEIQQTSDDIICASDRIFALFKGSYNNFYPATWLGTSPNGRSYRVRFEDGNITMIDSKHVRRFELRPGDIVKVDMPEMRGTKNWIVQGLGSVQGTDAIDGIDVFGHSTVFVQDKGSRLSTGAEANDQRTVEVPLAYIYVTHTHWPKLTDREFVPPRDTSHDNKRQSTPSTGIQTSDTASPASRARRAGRPTVKVLSNLRDESARPLSPSKVGGLFSGMAFAISYGSNESEKTNVIRSITGNGGVILENGFDELFELPNLDDTIEKSPKKEGLHDANAANATLKLKPMYAELGFVALIADKHSRRAKYVQALALGLPTLSGRWIADSLDCSKNPPTTSTQPKPLSWSKYLLPAGESVYLNGAIRSRTLTTYEAVTASLATTVSNRDILLNGDGVLIVAPKKSKAVWEKRKAYAFLTIALGAGGVKRVNDLAEAKAIAAVEEKWKWVYVDGSVSEAAKALFDGGKKRKRDEVDAKAMVAGDGKVKVVNDEFVIQSLILGALVD